MGAIISADDACPLGDDNCDTKSEVPKAAVSYDSGTNTGKTLNAIHSTDWRDK